MAVAFMLSQTEFGRNDHQAGALYFTLTKMRDNIEKSYTNKNPPELPDE